MTIDNVASGSLSQRAYEALRASLVLGNFQPGERLLMQDIADKLGTSITPAREACLRLVSEQALEVKSGRFVMVPPLTRARYWQVRLIRMALEGLAVELAIDNATTADINEIAAIHDDFARAESSGSPVAARQLNRAFHFAVYKLCRLDMLLDQIENMWVIMGPMFNTYYNRTENNYVGAEAHLKLVTAMRRKDKVAARAALEEDITRGGMILLRYFDEKERAGAVTAAARL